MFPIRDHNPTAGPIVVVWLLLAANVALFLLAVVPAGLDGVYTYALRYGLVPDAFFADPIAHAPRLVTHLFVHGGAAHLIGNMIFLFVFGDNIEDRFGHVRFALFYLAAGLVAALVQVALVAGSNLPMVGASGAISAVLGAYVVLFPRKRVQAVVVPLILPWLVVNLVFRTRRFFLWWFPAWAYLGFWALLQLWEGFADVALTGGVAWWAHIAGFLFGALVSRSLVR
ncbi:rhomboid family intramembrane serine protease [soil metagenome]